MSTTCLRGTSQARPPSVSGASGGTVKETEPLPSGARLRGPSFAGFIFASMVKSQDRGTASSGVGSGEMPQMLLGFFGVFFG